MYNRRYHKAYWMMAQETTGYGLQQGTPWGSCVLEIKNGKGRLQVTAESLLPLRKGHYGVYAALSAQDRKTAVFCGILTPNSNGHGEMQWDFSADNVAEGLLAEDIFAVVVLAEETGQKGFIAPLTAYCQEKQEWQTAISAILQEREKMKEVQEEVRKDIQKKKKKKAVTTELRAAESMQTTEEISVVAEKAEQTESAKQEQQEEQEQEGQEEILEENIHGSFRGLLRKFQKEMDHLEEMGILSTDESRQIQGISTESPCAEETNTIQEKGITERTRTEVRIKLAQDNNAIKKEQAEAKEADKPWIFADHPVIYPFGKAEEWVCIQPEELTLLDNVPSRWQIDFFYMLPEYKDNHFILREENGCVFLGVPDIYSLENEKLAREHGFPIFCPVKGKTNVGYWIGKV